MFSGLSLSSTLLWFGAAVYAALTTGSVVRLLASLGADREVVRKRLASLATWWVLAVVVTGAVLAGPLGVCLLMGVTSVLALCEYARLVQPAPASRRPLLLALALVPIHFALIFFGLREAALVVVPLAGLFLLAVERLAAGQTDGYIRAAGGMFWGLIVLVFGLSHAAMLMTLPDASNAAAGAAGWFLYLVLLTELNDIAQALVGRRFGAHKRHRIAPRVSPNKTWEGFLGGLLVTVILAAVLAPLLTPLADLPLRVAGRAWQIPFFWPVVIGLLIAVAGFFGDINMSAVKRDAGVKDSGRLLPGMGGVIDRIDSLTFTAPILYYLVTWIV